MKQTAASIFAPCRCKYSTYTVLPHECAVALVHKTCVPFFPETIIYQVSPYTSSPNLLATPNWPRGMRPSSTVSWIVSLPSGYKAQVQFVNVSQPKCNDRHTAIKVKMLDSEEELLTRREDEKTDDKLLVPHSFYLNMSNCIPESGNFGAVTKIVLEPKTGTKMFTWDAIYVCKKNTLKR